MVFSTFRRFDDPEAFYGDIRARRVDGVITGRGQFRAELTRIDFERVLMQRAEEHLPRVLHMENDPQRAAVIFVTGQSPLATRISGLSLRAGEIIAWDSGVARHHRATSAGGWGSISLKFEDLSTYSETILGHALPTPSDPRVIRPPEPAARRLLDLHETAGHLARATPDLLATPEVGRAIEQALVEAFVACLAGDEAGKQRSGSRNHVAVLRRLELVLQANPEQALYMAELCAAVGASYPTLRTCCQEHLGMSPKRYLWLRRMHLARRALRNADPETTTVTQVATELGFWELGRFSVTYRSLFGESPSITLRAPLDPKPEKINCSPWEFIKTA